MIDRDKCIKLIAEAREVARLTTSPYPGTAAERSERLGAVNLAVERHGAMADQLEEALSHIAMLQRDIDEANANAPHALVNALESLTRRSVELENARLDADRLKESICAASTVLSRGPKETLEQAAERVAVACMDRARERNAAQWEADRMRPVVKAAEHWREMRYPQGRSWKADCGEDMDLVSAVDTYRKDKP